MRLLVLLGLLLATFGSALADEPNWIPSLEAAKQQARTTGRPILCLVVGSGDRDSKKLVRDFEKQKKIRDLVPRFHLVKLQKASHGDLVAKYGLKHTPSTVFFTNLGAPVKIVSGRVSATKYASHMQAVLDKIAAAWSRRYKPTTKTKEGGNPKPTPPKLIHSLSCPDGCSHCSPAIEKALAWLARRQKQDGRWVKEKSETVTKNEAGKIVTRSIDHVDVALTAVAGMAFLAEGSTPAAGTHRSALRKAVDFAKGAVRPDGIISDESGNDFLYFVHANFETALGAMFLAEALASHPDADLATALGRVVAYFERIQDPRSGAWGYSYDFREHPSYVKRGWRLLATTFSGLAALNHMEAAGLTVDPGVRAKAVRYILSCLGRDRLFAYRAEYRRGKGYAGATAGALFALGRSGQPVESTFEAVMPPYRKALQRFHEYGKHWWFMLLFTALALDDVAPEALADLHVRFRDRLLADQNDDGHWDEPDGNGGAVFATAVGAIVLQMGRGRLPLAGRGRSETEIDVVDDPDYLTPPHPTSRVKVFRHQGVYRVDLDVCVDRLADEAWLAALVRGIAAANRRLYDVTDGQMLMNRVRIHPGGAKKDTADILITKDFHDREKNPHPWGHGITLVAKRTDIVSGREKERLRIGEWVMLPFGSRWDSPAGVNVLAHELCHYLFGAQDEYGRTTGKRYCDCIVGGPQLTELCRPDNHSDDRYEESCWELAKALYPQMVVPTEPDPGPWDPPRPEITVIR